jgi:hypothetical protein
MRSPLVRVVDRGTKSPNFLPNCLEVLPSTVLSVTWVYHRQELKKGERMQLHIGKELALLQRMTTRELRAKYAEVFGEETRATNRTWMIKRIAWRLQALAEGGLSERAQRRAAELANDADLRTTVPKAAYAEKISLATAGAKALTMGRDRRLPLPGTVLTRHYKGNLLQVKVLDKGFEFAGMVFPSLSAVAKVITGSHCNGYLFFGLTRKGGDQ